jgi:thymidylate kinase
MSARAQPVDREASARPVLGLVTALLSDLAAREVVFCHWKSNDHLDRSLSGDNDLDLLVDRRHAGLLTEAAAALGFKRAVARLDRTFPTLEDWYGVDPETQRFVHLHVHYQLVLGEPLIKNHRLPLEDAMLATRRMDGPMPVPDPACDAAVLVIRAILKQRALQLLRPASRKRLAEHSRAELTFLLERTDPARARAFVAQHLAGLPPDLFAEALESLLSDTPLARRLAIRRRLLAALAPHRRRSRARAAAAFGVRRSYLWLARFFEGGIPRKQPAAGGFVVALVGSDGSGKSTAIAELSRWLGRPYSVASVHLGKPPRGWSARLLDGLTSRARRLAGPAAGTGWSLPGDAPEAPALLQWLSALQLALLARDRFREYLRVRKLVARGTIVLCDRYPRHDLALMESSAAHALPLAGHWAFRALVRSERRSYERIGPPDLTLVLRVTPEVAAGRTGDDPEFVLRRAREVQDFTAAPPDDVVVIDADQPLEGVLAELRRTVWSAL